MAGDEGTGADGPHGRLVVWDFDGTLADSFRAIHVAADAALSACELGPCDPARLRSLVGLSLERMFARLAGADGEPLGDPRLVERLVAAYRHEFRAGGPAGTRLFPGIADLLIELHRAGVPQVIASSKSHRGVVLMLGHLGIAEAFAGVVADDDVTAKKPEPEMVLRACTDHGCRPADTVVVGDTEFDIRMGAAAGATTIGVTWGNKSRDVLAAASPTWLVDDVDELAALLRVLVAERA